jgi:hypothetical protein
VIPAGGLSADHKRWVRPRYGITSLHNQSCLRKNARSAWIGSEECHDPTVANHRVTEARQGLAANRIARLHQQVPLSKDSSSA